MRHNSSAQSDKRLRFSIRKFKAGVASVAIAAFWITNGAPVVSANTEATATEAPVTTVDSENQSTTADQKITDQATTKPTLDIEKSEAEVATGKETLALAAVPTQNKSALETALNRAAALDRSSLPVDQLAQIDYLTNAAAAVSSQEEINELATILNSYLDRLPAMAVATPASAGTERAVADRKKGATFVAADGVTIKEVDGTATSAIPTTGFTSTEPTVINMQTGQPGTNSSTPTTVHHDPSKQTFAVIYTAHLGNRNNPYVGFEDSGKIWFNPSGDYNTSEKKGLFGKKEYTRVDQIAFSTDKNGSGNVYATYYDKSGNIVKQDQFAAGQPKTITYGTGGEAYHFIYNPNNNSPYVSVYGPHPDGWFNELYTNYTKPVNWLTSNRHLGYGWYVPRLVDRPTYYKVEGTNQLLGTVIQTEMAGYKVQTAAPQEIKTADGKTYQLVPEKTENPTGQISPFTKKGDKVTVGTDYGYRIEFEKINDTDLSLRWTVLTPDGQPTVATGGTIGTGGADTIHHPNETTGIVNLGDKIHTTTIKTPYYENAITYFISHLDNNPTSTTYYYKEIKTEEKKGSVETRYHIVDKAGNVVTQDAIAKEAVVTDAPENSEYDATSKKKPEIEVGGKTYVLVTPETSKHPATDGASETGQVEADKIKVVNYYYVEKPVEAPKTGNVEVNYFTLENGQSTPLSGNAEGLKDKPSVNAVEVDTKDGKEGDSYDTTDFRPSSITDANGVKWVLSPSDTSGDDEKGTVEAGKTKVVEYYYIKEPAKTGSVVVNYVDTEGNVLQQQYTDTKDAPVGKSYDATENNEKPSEIVKDGKTYVLAPAGNYPIGEVTEDNNLRSSNKEEYKLAIDAIKGEIIPGERAVTYVYKLKEDTPEAPKPTGNVTVEHITTTGAVLKPETPVKTNEPTGTPYETKPEDKIVTEDGRTFVYKEVKQDSAPPTGTVTETPQKVTYVYEEVKGDVKVHYVNEAGETIKTSVVDTPESPTGTSYNTADDNKPNRITTEDGKVYEYVRVQEGSAPEEGKVVEGTTNVTYVYREVPKTPETPTPEAPKPTGNVTVEHITTTGAVLKPETPVKTNEPTGTPYETKPEDKIVTEDGRTFVYKEVKQDSAPPAGTVTETPQKVTYVYEEVKGDVKVHYVNEAGETIKTSVVDTPESPTGTSYNTADDNKPNRITTEDGKVYEYVRVQEGSAPEEGKVVEGTTNVTYVYREVKQPIIPTLLTPNRLTQPTIENQPAKEVIKQASASNQVLPNTGEKASTAVVIGSIATVIGLIGLRRRKED
ncbi:MucBP domain-containing protein [Streptococcus sp. S784/96/1]|uniref:MucBP domain-containing protein n=1 Tax=Streptococcus sp. S784/96/1 TaxID=2653499 RepID=UPI0013872CEF|nr:MucBP domain-containing protein [Streptococcus sp. S784/96/1]